MRALGKGGLAGLAAALVAGLIAGCGGSSGPPTLSWYIFPEPSGSFAHAAQVCSQASGGKYKIALNTLPTDADGQRQELVRRLAAKDSSIDIIGMDVTYTPEFADAGWLRPWTGANRNALKGDLPGPLATASWKGTIYGAPDNSNAQLLWYRKDLVPNPPKTSAQMLADATQLAKEGKPHYIEIQGKEYEGLTVWFNSLVDSAGGSILKGPRTVSLGRRPRRPRRSSTTSPRRRGRSGPVQLRRERRTPGLRERQRGLRAQLSVRVSGDPGRQPQARPSRSATPTTPRSSPASRPR